MTPKEPGPLSPDEVLDLVTDWRMTHLPGRTREEIYSGTANFAKTDSEIYQDWVETAVTWHNEGRDPKG